MTQTFKRYIRGRRGAASPAASVDWSGGHADRAEVVQAAGMDPVDEEIVIGVLTEAWGSHPAGALVVSGPTTPGLPFAVSLTAR
jgi:hypothetical protein